MFVLLDGKLGSSEPGYWSLIRQYAAVLHLYIRTGRCPVFQSCSKTVRCPVLQSCSKTVRYPVVSGLGPLSTNRIGILNAENKGLGLSPLSANMLGIFNAC